jgi:hypothetical protein
MSNGAVTGVGTATIGALLRNPIFLIIFAIGLIVFALVGIGICLAVPHWIVAFALFILAIVVLMSGLSPGWKIGLFILFIASAIIIFTQPQLVGLSVVG